MPDDMNDDFDIDTSELENLPADAVEDTDDDLDEDFGLSYDGLTQAEIDAINTDDSDGDESDESDEADSDNDGAADDIGATEDDADNTDEADGANANSDSADDDFQQEAATVADKRTAIDAEFDAKLSELDALGEQYDNGDIADGAYNAAKARIDRELKRIETRESELVTKEDAIAERETSKQEQFQNDWSVAVTSFMGKPENKSFVEGSPEFAALDQQLGVIAQSMPPGTPFDVLLDKARQAVSSYMAIEPMGAQDKPADKSVKAEPEHMPSISNMPSVVANSNEGNKFAHLDKLDGPALERAISDMSEAQQTEYLAQ